MCRRHVRWVCSQVLGLCEIVLAHYWSPLSLCTINSVQTGMLYTLQVPEQVAISVFDESRITDVVSPTGELPASLCALYSEVEFCSCLNRCCMSDLSRSREKANHFVLSRCRMRAIVSASKMWAFDYMLFFSWKGTRQSSTSRSDAYVAELGPKTSWEAFNLRSFEGQWARRSECPWQRNNWGCHCLCCHIRASWIFFNWQQL